MARALGRTGGRQKKLADPKRLSLAQAFYNGGTTDIATIWGTLGISRATLYRYLKSRSDEQPTGGSRAYRSSQDRAD